MRRYSLANGRLPANMPAMLAPPTSGTVARDAESDQIRALIRWLHAVAVLVVIMVIVGGITRLTESGLSITEWKPVSGALPPLTAADWEHEFALYRETTQYKQLNVGMSMADFQFIFFWEWVHRLLGRIIGLAFAIPLIWFAMRRMIPAGFGLRLLVLLALGGMQGVVGWWMVVSGLSGRTEVSHYRLAVHLCLALFILGAIMWTARDLAAVSRDSSARPARLSRSVTLVLLLLAVQLVWGAFTAGLRAGYAFPTWPLMGDEFFPAATPMVQPWLVNLVDNPIVVQFIHRWWAFVAAAALIWLGVKALRTGSAAGGVLHLLVVVQILLGIATLYSGVELWIAVAHQGVAALLVAATAWCANRVSRADGSPVASLSSLSVAA
jgi:cytochrome c oxidase assembly protein subunit 15